MTPTWRKPVGMLVIVAMIAVWVVLVASFSGTVGRWPILVQLVFYVVTGIIWLWILPMRRMLLWMETGRWR
jgi:hypothetical protein